jgi:PEP-CTERM motif
VDAFTAWTTADPVSGLTTSLSFVADLGTPVEGSVSGGGLNLRGAEIDLLASIDAFFWDPGNNAAQGETFFNTVATPVRLTSGTADYAGTRAIAGADITINNNAGAVYSLDVFRRLLTHEIGHAIGMGDDEGDLSPGTFIDDNFDASSSAAALATLTNSWALLVNPLDPASSPLARYTVPFANPGILTPGVDLLMESRGLGISAGNPVTNHFPLTNDEYGTRQFLYPSASAVPEPGTFMLLTVGLAGQALVRRRRRSQAPGGHSAFSR